MKRELNHLRSPGSFLVALRGPFWKVPGRRGSFVKKDQSHPQQDSAWIWATPALTTASHCTHLGCTCLLFGCPVGELCVVPDVGIPEREERRPPRQCNWQKGEVYYWLEPGSSAAPMQWCRSESPKPKLLHKFIGWAHAIGLSRLVTSLQSNFIGQNFLHRWDFPGGFRPIPNFLIGKQWSVLSKS